MAPPSADCNLIFGLLALQMEFVTREQLLEAMSGWMLRKTMTLGEILRQRGVLNERRLKLLHGLVEEHVEQHGDAQASLSALRVEAAVRHDLDRLDDADVQASVASLATRTGLGTSEDSLSSPATVCPLPRVPLADGIRFRRLRAHARGGLGEVFVARDEELKREVALKEIQERFADEPDARSRFVREAEITGHLEHPGVVPVYGMGAYADGRPYYAMRFIRGESMQNAISRFHQADENPRRDRGERSLALRELLGRFVAVCNAMAYAHSREVIHRDLKPANVMLGEFGETLVVDWGLAKLLDKETGRQGDKERGLVSVSLSPCLLVSLSNVESGSHTEAGAVLGTPSYMPPEQASGRHAEVGPASDIFALGATLYCLLTGAPPYQGDDSLIQAAVGECVPARQRKPSVPAALEAICAKAMAARPAERFRKARSLAEDVQRYLAGEPVSAYREPLMDRVRRWGRRHRTLVSVGVSLLLLGVVALAVGLWRVNAEKERTAQQRDRAVEAEQLAQESLKLAREAIDECYNVAYKDPLFQGPRMEKARNLLLRKTLRFYKNFRVQRPDDRALQRDEAAQWFRVGHIEQVLLRTQDAREAYERARQLYQTLVQARPELTVYQQELAMTHNNLGILLAALGQRAEALTEYQQGRSLQQKLVQTHPESPEYQKALASTHHNLGTLLADLGHGAEALKEYQQARTLHQKLAQAHPELPEHQNDLASTHNSLGNLLSALGQRAEAVKEFQKARTLQQKLVQAHPELPEYQNGLFLTYINLGKLLAEVGQRAEAVREFQQARTLLLKLVQTHPELPRYQQLLATTHNNLATLLAAQGQRAEALKEHQQARSLQQKLVAAHPELPEYQNDLARTHYNLGMLLAAQGQPAEAVKEFQQAHSLRLKLVQADPELPAYQQGLASTHNNLGKLLSDLGHGAEALAEYQQARTLRLKLVQAHPELPAYQNELAGTHYNLATLLSAQGQRAEALKEYQQARSLQQKLVQTHPDVSEYQNELARTHHNLGALLSGLGQRAEALKEYQQARSLLLKLVQAHPKLSEYQHALALTHNNLGVLLMNLGQGAEALKEYQQALTLFQKLIQAHPDVPDHTVGLARICFNRSLVLLQMNRQLEALADLDKLIRQADRLRKLAPHNPMSETFLLIGLPRRGALLARLGRGESADADWDRVLKIAPVAQRAGLRFQRADGRARAGDYLRAAAEADRLASENGIAAETLYNLACIQALNAGAAGRDAARPLPQREKRSEQYARAAVELLGRAAKAGYFRDPRIVEHLDKDDDLAALREREDYRAFREALRAASSDSGSSQ